MFGGTAQPVAELRNLVRADVPVGVLPGKVQGVEMAVDQLLVVVRAALDGRQNFAEAAGNEGHELVAHCRADVAQLATAAKCIVEQRLIAGVDSHPLNGRIEAMQFVTQPVAEVLLERIDLGPRTTDGLVARNPSRSANLLLKIGLNRKLACAVIA